jgi:hypothetical protein
MMLAIPWFRCGLSETDPTTQAAGSAVLTLLEVLNLKISGTPSDAASGFDTFHSILRYSWFWRLNVLNSCSEGRKESYAGYR